MSAPVAAFRLPGRPGRFRLALVLLAAAAAARAQDRPLVGALDSVGMTVSDMDRAVDFYSRVLTFEKVSDVEVTGSDYERLQGVFGLRMRVVRMRLGEEGIELFAARVEFISPGAVALPQGELGFREGFLVRDPDGHAMQLVEKGER